MQIAKHHRFRITVGITWRGEYVLGVLEEEGECKTSYLRHIGLGYDIIDTLDKLELKGFINVKKVNGRLRLHSLTDLGREYLQQVKEIYK